MNIISRMVLVVWSGDCKYYLCGLLEQHTPGRLDTPLCRCHRRRCLRRKRLRMKKKNKTKWACDVIRRVSSLNGLWRRANQLALFSSILFIDRRRQDLVTGQDRIVIHCIWMTLFANSLNNQRRRIEQILGRPLNRKEPSRIGLAADKTRRRRSTSKPNISWEKRDEQKKTGILCVDRLGVPRRLTGWISSTTLDCFASILFMDVIVVPADHFLFEDLV